MQILFQLRIWALCFSIKTDPDFKAAIQIMPATKGNESCDRIKSASSEGTDAKTGIKIQPTEKQPGSPVTVAGLGQIIFNH